MNVEHLELEKILKKAQIWSNTLSVVIAIVTAGSVAYGFYYNTNSTLTIQKEKIEVLQYDVAQVEAKINESAVFQGVSSTQIKALEDKVNSIDKKMDKIDDKLDKILLKK